MVFTLKLIQKFLRGMKHGIRQYFADKKFTLPDNSEALIYKVIKIQNETKYGHNSSKLCEIK